MNQAFAFKSQLNDQVNAAEHKNTVGGTLGVPFSPQEGIITENFGNYTATL